MNTWRPYAAYQFRIIIFKILGNNKKKMFEKISEPEGHILLKIKIFLAQNGFMTVIIQKPHECIIHIKYSTKFLNFNFNFTKKYKNQRNLILLML